MLGIKFFKYIGTTNGMPTFTVNYNNKKYYVENVQDLPNRTFIKNFLYVGIIKRNTPNEGYIKLGVNGKSICKYAKEVLKLKKHYDKEMEDLYKKVYIEDKKVSKYIYDTFNLKNKLQVDDRILLRGVSRYIITLCWKTY